MIRISTPGVNGRMNARRHQRACTECIEGGEGFPQTKRGGPRVEETSVTRRAMRRQTTTVFTALALVVASGCASNEATPRSPYASPPPREASLDRAPGWLVRGCRGWFADPAGGERVVCGIGSAPAYRDRVAARETAIARGRAEIARSLEVTIESLVRLTERGTNDVDDDELESIIHQLSSTSMRARCHPGGTRRGCGSSGCG